MTVIVYRFIPPMAWLCSSSWSFHLCPMAIFFSRRCLWSIWMPVGVAGRGALSRKMLPMWCSRRVADSRILGGKSCPAIARKRKLQTNSCCACGSRFCAHERKIKQTDAQNKSMCSKFFRKQRLSMDLHRTCFFELFGCTPGFGNAFALPAANKECRLVPRCIRRNYSRCECRVPAIVHGTAFAGLDFLSALPCSLRRGFCGLPQKSSIALPSRP